MSKTQFTSFVWFASVFCLPLLVYMGTSISHITGLPFDGGYPLYDAKTSSSTAVLIGVPFATIVTVLSAFEIFRNEKFFKVWSVTVMMAMLVIALLVMHL